MYRPIQVVVVIEQSLHYVYALYTLSPPNINLVQSAVLMNMQLVNTSTIPQCSTVPKNTPHLRYSLRPNNLQIYVYGHRALFHI